MSIVNPEAPLRVALFEPRIPPNTGNIARTCAAFQLPLSLIEPLGFQIDDRSLRRAGLDYWPHVQVSTHGSFDALKDGLLPHNRIIGCSRRGGSCLSEFEFQHGDVLLFGREDTGPS
jgi:tRNA (cytidine/uridine-2'-O-)-methyltransferase